jgi:Xaa-Pro aminopeptidase
VSGGVVAIEPGVYFPGKFGIRLEDEIIVKD